MFENIVTHTIETNN